MKIKDFRTMKEIEGDFGVADDMEIDVGCPICGAEIGQQCSVDDPNDDGLSRELVQFVRSERIDASNLEEIPFTAYGKKEDWE